MTGSSTGGTRYATAPRIVALDVNSLYTGLATLGSLAALACACGSVGQPAGASTFVVGQDQAGKTVHARVGDTVRFSLEDSSPVPGVSLTWRVTSSSISIVSPVSTTEPSPAPLHGSWPYTADFVAQAAGQAILTAHRYSTCEAMAGPCPGQEFTITVVVSS
jgi:hypothetical protein